MKTSPTTAKRFIVMGVLWTWAMLMGQPNPLQAQDKPVFTLINLDMESYPYVMLERDRMKLNREDITDYTYLASTFKSHSDPLTEHLYKPLPQSVKSALEKYQLGADPSDQLKDAIIDGLNTLIEGPMLYDEQVMRSYFKATEGVDVDNPVDRLPATIARRIEKNEFGAYVNRPIIDYFYGFGIKKYRSTLFEQLNTEFKRYDQLDYREPDAIEALQVFKAQAEIDGVRDTLTYRAKSVIGYDENEIIRATADPEVIEGLRQKGADYLVFATLSGYAPSGLTGIVAKGALVLQLNYINVETRELFTLSVGVESPIALSKSLGGQGSKTDPQSIDQAYQGLALSAAHALKVSFGENNQKAIDILTELRMLDTEIKAMKPPKSIGLYLQVMAWGLTAYSTASLAGAFGTVKGSPYGKANLLTSIGFHGGLTWLYIIYAPKFMKPFMKIKRGRLKRQYRRITGNDVPAVI
jgi:hypothetical protein